MFPPPFYFDDFLTPPLPPDFFIFPDLPGFLPLLGEGGPDVPELASSPAVVSEKAKKMDF